MSTPNRHNSQNNNPNQRNQRQGFHYLKVIEFVLSNNDKVANVPITTTIQRSIKETAAPNILVAECQ